MTSRRAGSPGFRYGLYITTVALSAACGLVIEIVAGRMLAPFLGMSLYTWTAIIAVVLAGFSGGHWLGGRLADRPDVSAHKTVAWTLLFCALSTGASLILIRLLSGPIIRLELAAVPTIVLLTSILFFLPSFFVGILSPILTKLAITQQPERTGRILGAMYAAGAFGSIIGTLAAGFVFISWLGSIGTVLLVSAVYLALAMFFFVWLARDARSDVVLPLIVAVSAGMLFAAAGAKVAAFAPNCRAESSYYCIRVVDITRQLGVAARTMVLDHLGHGINIREAPQRFESSYVELTDRLVTLHMERGAPFKAYFVGGGAYTLPRAWLQRNPPIAMTVAELDPMVTHLAMQEMWLSPAPNLEVRHEDARRLLARQPSKRYDVIIGDAFHDIAVPQHLVTKEFFALVRARLRQRGIYLMTAVDRADKPRLMLSLAKTLGEVFPVTEIWLDAEQAAGGGRATFILMAGGRATLRGLLSSTQFPGRTWRRWNNREITRLNSALRPLILTDDYSPVDRLLGNY